MWYSTFGTEQKLYKILAKKLQKGQNGANLCSGENNIKMDIKEIGRDVQI
jgi:hypothetical protein